MSYTPLNTGASPLHYDLSFEPGFASKDSNTFTGRERLTLEITQPLSEIRLNQKGLTLTNVVLMLCKGSSRPVSPVSIPPHSIIYDNEAQTALIRFPKTIEVGQATLEMDFSGKLGRGEGLYKSPYQGRNREEEYMLTTQMEAPYARQAFPCIDEPAAKARFDISVTLDSTLQAISNCPPKHVEHLDNNRKKVTFATTPLMSTYLVYLGAGDFDTIFSRQGDIPLRVVTTPGKSEKGRFALEIAKKFLPYYEDYFGIEFPLPKLDLIAVPDFPAGAMENWGAITFGERFLLYDEHRSSLSEKQTVANTLAHELVHQWFGDLVTMQWWDDLWLNESFADFLSNKAVHHFYPELEPWPDFLNSSNSAYNLDSLASSHPINVPVKTPQESEEVFDAISYRKGGMVLRMLEAYLGEDVFRNGIQKYLLRNSYGNTKGSDLWRDLSEVSGKSITPLVESWINQTGHPVLFAERNGRGLRLSQKKFLYSGSASGTTWHIPLSVTTDKGTTRQLMESRETLTKIPLPKGHSWVKVNGDETGFFRVEYSDELLSELEQAVSTKQLNDLDRWGLHKDVYALCLATDVPLKRYLSFVQSYSDEDSYLVLNGITSFLEKLTLLTCGQEYRPEIAQAAARAYKNILTAVGVDKREGEKDTIMQVRASALGGLGRLEDGIANRDRVSSMFHGLLKDPSSVHPDLRGAIYSVTAWNGDKETYDQLIELYRQEKQKAEQVRLLTALSGFTDHILLGRTLGMTFSEEVKMENAWHILRGLSNNPAGKELVWPWLKENWEEVKKRYDSAYLQHLNCTIPLLSTMADAKIGTEIANHMRTNLIPGTQRAIANLEEQMGINDRFVKSAEKEFAHVESSL